MLSGAAGYTYGCNEVWQMNATHTTPLFGAHLSWQEALELPGAGQMKILRQVFESLPWQQMHPSRKILSGINWPFTQKKMALATADQSCILVYQPTGSKIKLTLNKSILRDTSAYWINPHDGEVIDIEGKPSKTFQTPNRLQDWLLLILSSEQKEQWQYPRS